MAQWIEYIDWFHHERPGVAAEVLSRCRGGDHSPHSWLSRAVSASSNRVVDIGCGSGPMSRMLVREGRTVLGIDLSMNEMLEAQRLGPGPWARADALRLPVADASVDAVISSMALAVIQPTTALLTEIARVLRPGGMFAGITPTYRPINITDMRLLGPLTLKLGGPPRFPVRLDMSMGPLLAESGLRKVEDARERYYFEVHSLEDAELLLHALYLPTNGEAKVGEAARWLVDQLDGKESVNVPIPIRRVVAMK